MSYIADDRETAFNEANTMVTIAGEKISLGDLLGDGMAMKPAAEDDGMPGEYVKSAREVLMDLLTEAELYAKFQAATAADPDATNVDRSAYDGRLNNIAERAQGAVDMIFGTHIEADAGATPAISIGDKMVNIITDGTLPTDDTSPTLPASNSATRTMSGPPRRCGGSTACWTRCLRWTPLSTRPRMATTACSRTRSARMPR